MEPPAAQPVPVATHDYPSTIDKAVINALPLCRYDGPITVVSTQVDVLEALEDLAEDTLLGFDTETRPTFQRGQSFPPALLQLAGSRHVYLFQLGALGDLGPLFRLLSEPSVLKVGIAIRDDIRKLQDLEPFPAHGFLELSSITQQHGIVNTGLRALAAIFLGTRVSKGAQVTNWSRRDLTEAQIQYAATDAWVSRELFLRLRSLGWMPDDYSGF